MLNKLTLTTIVVAVILMGLGYCSTASAQISNAQIWDVQTPNNYSGGVRANDGFFFGAEGLYWALPSPKSSVVGNEAVEGENAYNLGWTIRNNSTVYYIKKDTSDDEDEDEEDDEEDDNSDDGGGNNGEVNIGGGSDTSISDLIKDGYDKVTDKEFLDYEADTYGPQGVLSSTTQGNSWNTNLLDTKFHVGQRYTFGFMSGHNGWECSVFTIDGKTDMSGSAIQLGLEDNNNNADGLGSNYLAGTFNNTQRKDNWEDCTQDGNDLLVDRMLVQFDSARMWDEINTWGVELNYLRRAHATRVGMFELGLGVRYMKWNEEFGFWGGSDRSGSGEIYAPNFLDDTSIETESDNNMVGPQLGLKWSRQTGRFGMEVLAKFTAAYNAQQVMNTSALGTNGYANGLYGSEGIYGDIYVAEEDSDTAQKWQQYVQTNLPANGITGYSKESFDVFTPIVELGVKFNFDLTSKVKFSLGWSGIYAGNIARPAGMTDYTLDYSTGTVMGVHGDHKSDVFMHGFVFGLTLNR